MELVELLFRAEKRLSGLHPLVADKARALIRKAYEEGIYIIITQGFRTIEEQNRLYALGRTKPGRIVTNARGGYSYHNFGLAFDVCVCNVFKGTLILAGASTAGGFASVRSESRLALNGAGIGKASKITPIFNIHLAFRLHSCGREKSRRPLSWLKNRLSRPFRKWRGFF
ncbi:Peptidoglycan L-alanyl-D-glutamate endopeptidase CwlK precursor [Geobacillus sp. BCO2]|nr:Peptidoglycan L-alanyl-D-glutamate endopeptidase CwlK precursor [Geobacillus sp. BCO2]